MTSRGGGTGPAPREADSQGSCAPAPPDEGAPPAAPPPGENGPLRRVIRVVNPLGLHFRVADRLAKVARQFNCAVTVWNGDRRADGTSIWDLIALLVMPDSEVVLEVDGPDAARAVDQLAEILASPGGEDYTI
jgi:phosphotransferase system HPr (HPr) family protein